MSFPIFLNLLQAVVGAFTPWTWVVIGLPFMAATLAIFLARAQRPAQNEGVWRYLGGRWWGH